MDMIACIAHNADWALGWIPDQCSMFTEHLVRLCISNRRSTKDIWPSCLELSIAQHILHDLSHSKPGSPGIREPGTVLTCQKMGYMPKDWYRTGCVMTSVALSLGRSMDI
jgi:hypothetical protein